MEHGVPAEQLTDADLERELKHAHVKRHDTLESGTAHAFANHTARTFELEREFLRRFAERVPEAAEKIAGLDARS